MTKRNGGPTYIIDRHIHSGSLCLKFSFLSPSLFHLSFILHFLLLLFSDDKKKNDVSVLRFVNFILCLKSRM